MNLPLTKEEGQVLINLLDVAVKAQGLNIAGNALALALRVKALMDIESPPLEVVPPEEESPPAL